MNFFGSGAAFARKPAGESVNIFTVYQRTGKKATVICAGVIGGNNFLLCLLVKRGRFLYNGVENFSDAGRLP